MTSCLLHAALFDYHGVALWCGAAPWHVVRAAEETGLPAAEAGTLAHCLQSAATRGLLEEKRR